jgi:hypothetical protein
MGNKEFFKRGIFSFLMTISLVLMGIYLYNKCSNNPISNIIKNNKKQTIKTVIDTVYITKTLTKYINGKDIYNVDIEKIKSDTVFFKKIDTIKIVEDYLTHRLYIDTLFLENVNLIIRDTIYKNKIESRYLVSNIKDKIITKETTITDPLKNSLYFGGSIFQDKLFKINSISSSLLLKTKKDKIFILSLGIDNNKQPIIGTSYYIKIK